jgi:hypothetical protein
MVGWTMTRCPLLPYASGELSEAASNFVGEA